MGTPVTLENITYATATSPKDQDSGNPSARAVMAAAGKPGREPPPAHAGRAWGPPLTPACAPQ